MHSGLLLLPLLPPATCAQVYSRGRRLTTLRALSCVSEQNSPARTPRPPAPALDPRRAEHPHPRSELTPAPPADLVEHCAWLVRSLEPARLSSLPAASPRQPLRTGVATPRLNAVPRPSVRSRPCGPSRFTALASASLSRHSACLSAHLLDTAAPAFSALSTALASALPSLPHARALPAYHSICVGMCCKTSAHCPPLADSAADVFLRL